MCDVPWDYMYLSRHQISVFVNDYVVLGDCGCLPGHQAHSTGTTAHPADIWFVFGTTRALKTEEIQKNQKKKGKVRVSIPCLPSERIQTKGSKARVRFSHTEDRSLAVWLHMHPR